MHTVDIIVWTSFSCVAGKDYCLVAKNSKNLKNFCQHLIILMGFD